MVEGGGIILIIFNFIVDCLDNGDILLIIMLKNGVVNYDNF